MMAAEPANSLKLLEKDRVALFQQNLDKSQGLTREAVGKEEVVRHFLLRCLISALREGSKLGFKWPCKKTPKAWPGC